MVIHDDSGVHWWNGGFCLARGTRHWNCVLKLFCHCLKGEQHNIHNVHPTFQTQTKGKYKDSGVRHTLDLWHGAQNLAKRTHAASVTFNAKLCLFCKGNWFIVKRCCITWGLSWPQVCVCVSIQHRQKVYTEHVKLKMENYNGNMQFWQNNCVA